MTYRLQQDRRHYVFSRKSTRVMRGNKGYELVDSAHVNVSFYDKRYHVKVYGFGSQIPAVFTPGHIGSFATLEHAQAVAKVIADFTEMRIDMPRNPYINLS